MFCFVSINALSCFAWKTVTMKLGAANFCLEMLNELQKWASIATSLEPVAYR